MIDQAKRFLRFFFFAFNQSNRIHQSNWSEQRQQKLAFKSFMAIFLIFFCTDALTIIDDDERLFATKKKWNFYSNLMNILAALDFKERFDQDIQFSAVLLIFALLIFVIFVVVFCLRFFFIFIDPNKKKSIWSIWSIEWLIIW